ncbi:hypothetical protein [Nocardioides pakistanensis]
MTGGDLTSTAVIKKDCSGCTEPFRLDMATLTVTMKVPSNGLRGARHVPSHTVTAEATLAPNGVLVYWDCPRCGYAESEYADDETRNALT